MLRHPDTVTLNATAGSPFDVAARPKEGQELPEVARTYDRVRGHDHRSARIGDIGKIDIMRFYSGGDMSAVPESVTIIPKVFK